MNYDEDDGDGDYEDEEYVHLPLPPSFFKTPEKSCLRTSTSPSLTNKHVHFGEELISGPLSASVMTPNHSSIPATAHGMSPTAAMEAVPPMQQSRVRFQT
jgi:hypothetical protein